VKAGAARRESTSSWFSYDACRGIATDGRARSGRVRDSRMLRRPRGQRQAVLFEASARRGHPSSASPWEPRALARPRPAPASCSPSAAPLRVTPRWSRWPAETAPPKIVSPRGADLTAFRQLQHGMDGSVHFRSMISSSILERWTNVGVPV